MDIKKVYCWCYIVKTGIAFYQLLANFLSTLFYIVFVTPSLGEFLVENSKLVFESLQ